MLERIRNKMSEKQIDCLILTNKANIQWSIQKQILGYVFITAESVSVIASNAYRHEITEYNAEFASSREEYEQLLKNKSQNIQGNIRTDKESEKLEEIFNSQKTDIIEELRQIKTEKEIQNIRDACKITSKLLQHTKKQLFTGINELEAVADITKFYAEKGVQDAFLKNGGLSLVNANCLTAHAEPRERIIQSEDLVIVDSGCRVNHYCSDITRTYSKNPSKEKKQLFEDVKEIQQRILDEIQSGKQISELVELRDQLAEQKGYSPKEHILYTLGHGIGIEVHESPSLRYSTESKLEENMVVSVEPGLHVKKVGGVRIEDVVLVKENGCEILSNVEKELC